MAIIEIHGGRVTYRSLMNKTKGDLASRVLELMDALDRERERREAAYRAGFMASAEGWNGEHRPDAVNDPRFIETMQADLRREAAHA